MGITCEAQPEDLGPDEVAKVFLSAAGFLSFLLLVAVGAWVMFALGAVRHWCAALAITLGVC
jgi:hypothetical protein